MHETLVLFAQRPGGSGGEEAAGILGVVCMCGTWLLVLAVAILAIAGMWKIFVKAGQPGWAAIVPIYNMMVLAKIGGKEEWYGLLCLIPAVGIVFAIIIWLAVLEKFGKGVGFLVGLILLPYIFIPMLGFGSAQYQGDGGSRYGRRRSRRDDDDDDEDA